MLCSICTNEYLLVLQDFFMQKLMNLKMLDFSTFAFKKNIQARKNAYRSNEAQ